MRNSIIIFILAVVFFACGKDKNLDVNEHYFVRSNGADMSVWLKGSKANKTVIFIVHGGPGGSAMDYRMPSFTDPLEEKYVVVYWDQRGSGASMGNYDTTLFSIPQYVEDLYKVKKFVESELGTDYSWFLYGHSWGGLLGSSFMLNEQYQQEFSGWIESDGAHNMPLLNALERNMLIYYGRQELMAGNNKERWKEIVEYCESLDSVNIDMYESAQMNKYSYEAEGLLDSVYVGNGMTPGFALKYLLASQYAPISNWISNTWTNIMLREDVEESALSNQLYKIKIPTLLLWGKYDFVTPPELGYDALNNLGTEDKYLIIYENSGHAPMDAQPVEYVTDIINFIESYR